MSAGNAPHAASLPRICLITETYLPVIGGGETQARALAVGLGAAGLVTRVVTRRSDRGFAAAERIDGIEVIRLGPAGPGHLKKWAMLPGLLRHLLGPRTGEDVLLVCGYRVLGIAAVLAARRRGLPVVLKGDNQGEFSGEYFRAGAAKLGLGPRLVGRIVAARNRLLRRADAFVALSSDMRDELEANGVAPERIVQIPNSVDTARFRRAAGDRAASRRALGLPEDAPVVVFTGRLLESKGVLDLARVWKDIAADHPRAHLLIVGGGGGLMHDCEAALHAFLAEHGLEGSVMTTGYVDNVEDYLRAADIFAFPTRDEAFGISLIEAMSMGLAVVATRVGGIKDILEHEVNGLVIEPSDRAGLEAALRRLTGDSALRERLGHAAVETVARRYTAEAIVGRYTELLGGLVGTPRAGGHPAASKPHSAAKSDRS